MNSQTEYYLEFLITEAFKGKGFQKINDLFEEKLSCSSQRHGKALLTQIDKLINKELDRNEFQHVILLMKCIQHFCSCDYQDGFSLIQQGLVSKIILWFERTLEFLKIFVENNPSIAKLVEEFYDTAVVICRSNNKEGVKQLLDTFLLNLGIVITESWPPFYVRLEAVKTFNLILDQIPREDKKSLQTSEEMQSLMKTMARKLFEVGDYDVQVAISEALCRMAPKKLRESYAQEWFEDVYFAKAFVEVNDKDFETDCRRFLNCLNSKAPHATRVWLRKKLCLCLLPPIDIRVFTYPCVNAFADLVELQRPDDDKLKHFWIDFNVGSQCVSFYVQNDEGNLWDSVRLQKESVAGYNLQEAGGQKLLDIYPKISFLIIGKETKHVKICFERDYDIENAIIKTFGEDLKKSDSQDETKEKVLPTVGTSVQSPPRLQEKGHLNSPQAEVTYSEVNSKSKVQSPISGALESSAEVHHSYWNGIVFTFGDNAGQKWRLSVVQGGTAKGQAKYLAKFNYKIFYKNDLISSVSESESDKSWILEPKKSASKSADYSRKKQKPKGRLKVLPLSDSSNEDIAGKKDTSSSFTSLKKPSMQVKGKAKTLSFSDVKLPGVSALLTPGDSIQLSVSGTNNVSYLDEQDLMDPLQDLSSPECTLPKVFEKGDFQSGISSRIVPKVLENDEEPQKKRKRSDSGERELSFRPRKLFGSSERKLGPPEDLLKHNPEPSDFTGYSFISSFETFTKDLKSKMMAAYKKMESQAQDMLTVSHMHVSSLIGQIQQFKVRKLQHFHEIVTHELSELEVENQALNELEKETMVCAWDNAAIYSILYDALMQLVMDSTSSHCTSCVMYMGDAISQ
ncbi:synaptonemal complex protein 2-like [Gastrophryne carolinensis]